MWARVCECGPGRVSVDGGRARAIECGRGRVSVGEGV